MNQTRQGEMHIMKTKVRITQNQQGIYENFYIEFLQPRYPNSDYLEPFGFISFQAGGTPDHKDGKWYAFQMECKSEKPDEFLKCAKILSYIRKHRDDYRIQPEDVLKIVNAEEHVYKHGRFLPLSYHGYKMFRVLKGNEKEQGTDYYANIFAPSEPLALKELKRKGWDHMTLEFDSILDLNSKQETTYKFA